MITKNIYSTIHLLAILFFSGHLASLQADANFENGSYQEMVINGKKYHKVVSIHNPSYGKFICTRKVTDNKSGNVCHNMSHTHRIPKGHNVHDDIAIRAGVVRTRQIMTNLERNMRDFNLTYLFRGVENPFNDICTSKKYKKVEYMHNRPTQEVASIKEIIASYYDGQKEDRREQKTEILKLNQEGALEKYRKIKSMTEPESQKFNIFKPWSWCQ